MVDRDINFVKNSWLNCYSNSPWSGVLHKEEYFKEYAKIVQDVLADRDVKVLVAVNPQESDFEHEIFGYVVYEPQANLVHWVYVKDGLRGLGVGKFLFQSAEISNDFKYTFLTVAGNKILSKKNKSKEFNTYHAYSYIRKKARDRAEGIKTTSAYQGRSLLETRHSS